MRWSILTFLAGLLLLACGDSPTSPPGSENASPEAAAETDPLDAALREVPDPRSEKTNALLDEKRVTLDLKGSALTDVAAYVATLTGAPVVVLPSLFEERTAKELQVTLAAKDITAREALDRITGELGIVYWVEDGQVRIAGVRPPGESILLSHDVSDLVETRGFEIDALADMIREGVDREAWEEGGEIAAADDGEALSIRAPKDTHRRVRDFLKGLLAEAR